MKRLFTYGCSFTNYQYPTWAEYLGSLYDEHHTFALSGAGNYFSFSQFKRTLHEYDVSKNDTILFQITGIVRKDLIGADNEWVGGGNIFYNSNYSQNYINNCFDMINSAYDLYNNLKFLIYFKEYLNYNIIIIPMLSFEHKENLGEIGYRYQNDNTQYSNYLFKIIDNLYEIEKKYMVNTDMFTFQYSQKETPHSWYSHSEKRWVENDNHPSTKTHYEFAKYLVSNYLTNINSSNLYDESMINLVETWETFFSRVIDFKDGDKYLSQIDKYEYNHDMLGVGYPHHLTNTKYQHKTFLI